MTEIDGMKKPSPSVRETIELNSLRSKLAMVSNQAGNVARCATTTATREFAQDRQAEANAAVAHIEELLK